MIDLSRKLLLAVGLALVAPLAAAGDAKTVILATTTSTQDSGLPDVLVPAFSAAYVFTPSFRMGVSLEFPYTTISDLGVLSGEATTATGSLSTQRMLGAEPIFGFFSAHVLVGRLQVSRTIARRASEE